MSGIGIIPTPTKSAADYEAEYLDQAREAREEGNPSRANHYGALARSSGNTARQEASGRPPSYWIPV
jgi:hypothetical protein